MGVAGGMPPAVFKIAKLGKPISLPVAGGNWPENALHFPGVKMPRAEARGDSLTKYIIHQTSQETLKQLEPEYHLSRKTSFYWHFKKFCKKEKFCTH